MNVGIVSYWFNRGQATVGRYIRSIFDQAEYPTFVLARPTKEKFARPGFVANTDVWDQPRVTSASCFEIPFHEYQQWVRTNGIDLVFFDQNYQFDAIARLRRMGVATIGRFVWEDFRAEHVEGAKAAFDVVYSLTRAEQLRYRKFGIDSPYLRWGSQSELSAYAQTPKQKYLTFFYPGGYLSPRKPTGAILEAFSRVKRSDVRLLIKTQNNLRNVDLIIPKDRLQTRKKSNSDDDPVLQARARLLADPRISVIADDCEADRYYSLFASCHVCLAPSRWEGLGLHLFEAQAFGLPIITNDDPPMNEIVSHNENGYLVRSTNLGPTKSGVDAFEPDVSDLVRALEYFCDPGVLDQLTHKTKQVGSRLAWEHTENDYLQLVDAVRNRAQVSA